MVCLAVPSVHQCVSFSFRSLKQLEFRQEHAFFFMSPDRRWADAVPRQLQATFRQ